MNAKIGFLVLVVTAMMTGCGGRSLLVDCAASSLNVLPATATADHSAPPNGNHMQFFANNNVAALPSSCNYLPVSRRFHGDVSPLGTIRCFTYCEGPM